MLENNKGVKILVSCVISLVFLFVIIFLSISLTEKKSISDKLNVFEKQLAILKEENEDLQDQIIKYNEKVNTLENEKSILEEQNTNSLKALSDLQDKINTNTNSINNSSSHSINNENNSNSNVSNSGNQQNNNPNIQLSEKDKMVAEARKYFSDRGVKLSSSGYSEMVGTNLNSGINELEGHRVFAITIDNYDIKDNNIWFYYSPETKVGYKYQNETWTKV
ncbi:hypothetical protein [Clostridium polynesiense]|uniref:hypothetical protein n=1 Tax=Clostridium polynesiense TaxID=1325933 RepID=UPI00058B32BD|nr:hypothetical protein [Clostridium polynesiense]